MTDERAAASRRAKRSRPSGTGEASAWWRAWHPGRHLAWLALVALLAWLVWRAWA